MQKFGERLRVAMLASGITTSAQLATRCTRHIEGGLSRQTAAKWLKMDRAELAAEWLFPLADCLKVRARWLATGKGQLAGVSDEHWRRIGDIVAALSAKSSSHVENWLTEGEQMAQK